MLRTITIGSCISVQGMFLNDLSDGRIAVKVDENVFVGKPVSQSTKVLAKQQTDVNSAVSLTA
ncbi:MAG: hypothetical protein CL583_18015 [Alteromonadaceae bacterium]|nr:hypothetical protein [Alteromonadaceae bacterium]|tara:strand:- start:3337 stop:3525 length:189 start_codon:yes stop_codon:yes gene_type:complete